MLSFPLFLTVWMSQKFFQFPSALDFHLISTPGARRIIGSFSVQSVYWLGHEGIAPVQLYAQENIGIPPKVKHFRLAFMLQFLKLQNESFCLRESWIRILVSVSPTGQKLLLMLYFFVALHSMFGMMYRSPL